MKNLIVLSALLLFTEPELKKFESEEFKFSVQMPAGRQSQLSERKVSFGSIKSISVRGTDQFVNGLLKGNLVYRMFGDKYTINADVEGNKQEIIMKNMKASNEASFPMNDLTVQSKEEGKDYVYYVLKIEDKGFLEHRKIIVKNDIAYCLSIASQEKILSLDKVNEFFNSLQIKP